MFLLLFFFSCKKVEIQALDIFQKDHYAQSFFENFFQILGNSSLNNNYIELESFLENFLKNNHKKINISDLMLEKTSIKSFILSLKKDLFVLDNTFLKHIILIQKLFKYDIDNFSMWLYAKKLYESRHRTLSFQEYFIFNILNSINVEQNKSTIKESYLFYYNQFYVKIKLLYYSVYSDFDLPGVYFTSGIFNENSIFFEEKKIRLVYDFIQNLESEFNQPLIYREPCKKILLRALTQKKFNDFYYVLINSLKTHEEYLPVDFFLFLQNFKI